MYRNGLASFVYSKKEGESLFAEDRFAFLDISGDIVEPPVVEEGRLTIESKRNEAGVVLYGFVDTKGEWVIPPEYSSTEGFSDGLAAVQKGSGQDGKWGYIDKSGDVAIDFLYDEALPFVKGSAIVQLNSKFGMIDKNGSFIAEPVYDDVTLSARRSRYEGLTGFVKGGKIGFLNNSGDVVIDFKFKPAIPPMYDNTFHNGRAVVVLDEPGMEKAIIDTDGNVIRRIGSDIKLRPIFIDDYIAVLDGKRNIIFDRDGRKYDISSYLDDDKFTNAIMREMSHRLSLDANQIHLMVTSSNNVLASYIYFAHPYSMSIAFRYFTITPKGGIK
jgi:hypothetical protein